MRLPLDAQQPVTKPVAPKPFAFKHLPFQPKFIILKHMGTGNGWGEGLCAFNPKYWDIQTWPFFYSEY